MTDQEFYRLLLPAGLLDYFIVTKAENNQDSFTFHIEERNLPPSEYQKDKLLSKGFYDPITVQDFPLRGKACYLRVKRRRWINEDTGDIVIRDWDIVAKGTRMTKEFATFLKGINR